MTSQFRSTPGAIWAVLSFLVAGCAQSLPTMDAADAASEATGLSEPIRFLTTAQPLDTQTAPSASLSLSEAAKLALTNSARLQAALAEVRAALAEAKQARLIANPVLDINIRFPEGGGDEVIEAGLSQSLINLLRRPARTRAADARLQAAAARAVSEALDVLREVEGVYASARAADEQLAVLEDQQSLFRQLLDVAEARQQAGEAGRLDLIGFQARQAALEALTARQAALQRSFRLRLTRLLGQPSGGVEWQLEPAPTPEPTEASDADWLAIALRSRPEIQAATFELAALGEDVRLASLEAFEDLAVGAEAESEEDFSAGPAVSLPIPLFDLGQHRRARAEAEVMAARHRLTEAQRQVVEDVRQALAAAEAARRAVALVQNELLPLQQERVAQTQAAYRAGFADVTDVLQAQQDLLDAQAQLIEARLRQQTAAADLKRAAGGVATPTLTTLTPTTATRTTR